MSMKTNRRTITRPQGGQSYHHRGASTDQERFTQANFHFLLSHNSPTTADFFSHDHLNDLPVWDDVEEVISATSNIHSCSICLNERPFLARITQCGHIFCEPCIFRYLTLDSSPDQKRDEPARFFKTPGIKKCPLCHQSISHPSLKPLYQPSYLALLTLYPQLNRRKAYFIRRSQFSLTFSLCEHQPNSCQAFPLSSQSIQTNQPYVYFPGEAFIPTFATDTMEKDNLKSLLHRERVELQELSDETAVFEQQSMGYIMDAIDRLKQRFIQSGIPFTNPLVTISIPDTSRQSPHPPSPPLPSFKPTAPPVPAISSNSVKSTSILSITAKTFVPEKNDLKKHFSDFPSLDTTMDAIEIEEKERRERERKQAEESKKLMEERRKLQEEETKRKFEEELEQKRREEKERELHRVLDTAFRTPASFQTIRNTNTQSSSNHTASPIVHSHPPSSSSFFYQLCDGQRVFLDPLFVSILSSFVQKSHPPKDSKPDNRFTFTPFSPKVDDSSAPSPTTKLQNSPPTSHLPLSLKVTPIHIRTEKKVEWHKRLEEAQLLTAKLLQMSRDKQALPDEQRDEHKTKEPKKWRELHKELKLMFHQFDRMTQHLPLDSSFHVVEFDLSEHVDTETLNQFSSILSSREKMWRDEESHYERMESMENERARHFEAQMEEESHRKVMEWWGLGDIRPIHQHNTSHDLLERDNWAALEEERPDEETEKKSDKKTTGGIWAMNDWAALEDKNEEEERRKREEVEARNKAAEERRKREQEKENEEFPWMAMIDQKTKESEGGKEDDDSKRRRKKQGKGKEQLLIYSTSSVRKH